MALRSSLKFGLLCVNAASFISCIVSFWALSKICFFSLKMIWQIKQVNPMFWMYMLEPVLKYLESGLYRWYSHIVWIVSSVFISQIWALSFSCLCCRIEVLVASWLKATWNCQCKTSRPFIGILTNFVFKIVKSPSKWLSPPLLWHSVPCTATVHVNEVRWGFFPLPFKSKRTTLA